MKHYVEGINGTCQWNINGIQWKPIRSGKNQYDSIGFHDGWEESIIGMEGVNAVQWNQWDSFRFAA